MKVFISWSGDRSKAVAKAYKVFLQGLVQSIEPWMSERDIAKGAAWFDEIMQALKGAKFGVICVTPENLDAPFLLFEAGALGGHFGKSHVAPLLIDVDHKSLKPPLSQFQGTLSNEKDILQLVETMMKAAVEAGDKVPDPETFKRLWGHLWKDLDAELKKVQGAGQPKVEKRSADELSEEILLTVRAVSDRLGDLEAIVRAIPRRNSIRLDALRNALGKDSNEVVAAPALS